jgi:hypothetical protein
VITRLSNVILRRRGFAGRSETNGNDFDLLLQQLLYQWYRADTRIRVKVQ